ncbi:hypothetical protein LPJ74_006565, partial [Coemansia sp. RSA 1843]
MSKRLLNNGHLATGPQPHASYSMASQHPPQPTASSTTTPRHEHSRINKVENLLQSHSSRDGTPAVDS